MLLLITDKNKKQIGVFMIRKFLFISLLSMTCIMSVIYIPKDGSCIPQPEEFKKGELIINDGLVSDDELKKLHQIFDHEMEHHKPYCIIDNVVHHGHRCKHGKGIPLNISWDYIVDHVFRPEFHLTARVAPQTANIPFCVNNKQCFRSNIKGFHHDYLGHAQNADIIQFNNIIQNGQPAVMIDPDLPYNANIEYDGACKPNASSFFPQSLKRDKVVQYIAQAFRNARVIDERRNQGYTLIGESNDGLPIVFEIEAAPAIPTLRPFTEQEMRKVEHRKKVEKTTGIIQRIGTAYPAV